MRYFFSILWLSCLWAFQLTEVIGQVTATRTLTGTVTDEMTGDTLPGVTIQLQGTKQGVATDVRGHYTLPQVPLTKVKLLVSYVGYDSREIRVEPGETVVNIKLGQRALALQEVVVVGYAPTMKRELTGAVAALPAPPRTGPTANTEDYTAIHENTFHDARQQPVTTFSADVDRASYSNVRRFLNNGTLPPKDAVRTEELINYFGYEYPQPTGDDLVAIHTELSESPWNPELQLLRIGLRARTIPNDKLPPANLVFLIDVSGSMMAENKLPLVKAALNLLVDQLRPQDRVALVVYAGAAGLVLPSTPGSEPQRIKDALNGLTAGGSTAGGAGLRLAYRVATEQFLKNGNNRVILATDGDFNVGESSDAAMERLVEKQRETGVYLSVLGFGMGNYKDNKLETLADKGNGNYAYIDNGQEARKIFVREFGGTLFTVARDVKLQLEFNPTLVKAYRLIGYENRLLRNEDFKDDRKDAGELGSGHTVTALYELIPAGTESAYLPQTDPLKYQKSTGPGGDQNRELATLKIRYKNPDENRSRQLEKPLEHRITPLAATSDDFRFAVAVAGFGLLLRDSEFRGKATFEQLAELARGATGPDAEGDRREFVRLVNAAGALAARDVAKK